MVHKIKTVEIKPVKFREDKSGRIHDYAVYFIHEDGTYTWGFAESTAVYNPGEIVEITDGMKARIDFEL